MLIRLLLIILFNYFVLSQVLPNDYKKFLGEDADIAKHPYQVSVQRRLFSNKTNETRSYHWCSGAILNETFIITAALCVHNKTVPRLVRIPPKELFLIFGQNESVLNRDSITREIETITVHPHFMNDRNFRYQHNLALLRVKGAILPFRKTHLIQPIKLNDNKTNLFDSLQCIVTGWGSTGETPHHLSYYDPAKHGIRRKTSPTLKKDTVVFILLDSCVQLFEIAGSAFYGFGKFCSQSLRNESRTASTNLCPVPDDVGSPMICNGTLTGIVSVETNCAEKLHPTVYSDIIWHLPWIRYRDVKFGYNYHDYRRSPSRQKSRSRSKPSKVPKRSASSKRFSHNFIFLVIAFAIKF